jgi:hypothetical protein
MSTLMPCPRPTDEDNAMAAIVNAKSGAVPQQFRGVEVLHRSGLWVINGKRYDRTRAAWKALLDVPERRGEG